MAVNFHSIAGAEKFLTLGAYCYDVVMMLAGHSGFHSCVTFFIEVVDDECG